MNIIEQSKCIYDAILADVVNTYDTVGGGGISSIKRTATQSYTVSISQEGRKDLIHYDITLGEDGAVSIASKSTSVKSY